jgi:hypothetical protein
MQTDLNTNFGTSPVQGVKVMERKASDNKYLHRDFHISLNILMGHISSNFGKDALISYLEQYAGAYYKPLKQELKLGNIGALFEYLTEIYAKEEWPVKIISDENYILVEQESCPGISHIKASGNQPCPGYRETYNTLYTTLCRDTPFEYTLEYFNDETGACKQIFKRKEGKL